MIDLERVKNYIDLGFEKEEALKMVRDEEKAEAKASAKNEKEVEKSEAGSASDDLISELKKEIEDLKGTIQEQRLAGATSGQPEKKTALDIMQSVYGGDGKNE